MSVPEWMQKFNEIGQKGDEAVTTIQEGGILKTEESHRNELGGGRGGAAAAAAGSDDGSSVPSSLTSGSRAKPPAPPPIKEEGKTAADDDDDDAAALFRSAGSKPAETKVAEDDDDAAALFRSAGSKPAESKVAEGGPAAPAAVGPPTEVNPALSSVIIDKSVIEESVEGSVIEESVIEESVIEESIDGTLVEEESVYEEESVIEESVVSSTVGQNQSQHGSTDGEGAPNTVQGETPDGEALPSTIEEEEAAAVDDEQADITPREKFQQKISDADFGSSWVIDQHQQFEDEEIAANDGHVHYEDVYLDDDGNEVIEEIAQGRDEDANAAGSIAASQSVDEITVDEDTFEDKIVGDESEMARSAFAPQQDDAAVVSPQDDQPVVDDVKPPSVHDRDDGDDDDEPSEAPYDPDYDIENQRKLLQKATKEKRSTMSPILLWVAFFAFAAASVLIVLFVVLNDDNNELNAVSPPTPSPTPINYLPDGTNPGEIDVASTTELAPVQPGNCNFSGLTQPHVIDQCACNGVIDTIADDVRVRYQDLVDRFIKPIIPDFVAEISSCLPENQALVWMSTGINNGGEAEDYVRRQRYSLAYFFIEQGGIGWRETTNWLSGRGECQWSRITCDEDGKVQIVNLDRNKVEGQLSGAIAIIESLQTFSVSQNDIVGTIPAEIIASTSLKSLDMSNNAFFGKIPRFRKGSRLQSLNVESNNLSGSLRPNIENAVSLNSLNVAFNAINGPLPVEVFSLPLTVLTIESNFMTGTIPNAIENAANLTSLTLGPNKFTGNIPVSLGSLTNLVRLSVREIPDLGGRLPASYGLALTNLVELQITATSIRGNIPEQFGAMTKLEVLDLGRNSFRGDLPPALGLLTNLKRLHLDDNTFSGTLPVQIGNLPALTELLLNTNELVGTIPSEFGDMGSLITLTLDGNFLDGRAPQEVCDLRRSRLNEFIVDCPERDNAGNAIGVICSIPSCCTECL